jgi:hypothetical protein
MVRWSRVELAAAAPAIIRSLAVVVGEDSNRWGLDAVHSTSPARQATRLNWKESIAPLMLAYSLK